MISLRMRMDIHPRCDRHPEHPMTPVMMQIAPDQPWFPAFVCDQPNCPRQFTLAQGYFNVFKQRIDPDTRRAVPCPREALPMYVADYEPVSKSWTWRCAQFGCDGTMMQVGVAAHIRGH